MNEFEKRQLVNRVIQRIERPNIAEGVARSPSISDIKKDIHLIQKELGEAKSALGFQGFLLFITTVIFIWIAFDLSSKHERITNLEKIVKETQEKKTP